ncbi:type VI secretion system-associated protein TagF [Mangrovitalea sediminis]|uniref:type VI secretion system-associated protein TagF n=1 Tax=Mangrovitalea sediminis TaxID=1982043 RepID=UPI000BE59229|nr:type VI secretion system-associated protein TagF [Mangrovitalea sediminis]
MPQEPVMEPGGLCGKIPSRGDFVDSGLPWDLQQPLTEWLQALIGVSRDQLQQHWLDLYLTSPVWRFATPAGAFGPYGCAGVMIPSVDRVGRYFPLVLLKTHGAAPIELHMHGAAWYDNLAALALSALEPNLDLAPLATTIRELPPVLAEQVIASPFQGQQSFRQQPSQPHYPWHIPTGATGNLGETSLAFLHHVLSKAVPAYSLWWTEGSASVDPTCLVCSGLPPISGYAAMLDGQWQQWGWEIHNFLAIIPHPEPAGAEA